MAVDGCEYLLFESLSLAISNLTISALYMTCRLVSNSI